MNKKEGNEQALKVSVHSIVVELWTSTWVIAVSNPAQTDVASA